VIDYDHLRCISNGHLFFTYTTPGNLSLTKDETLLGVVEFAPPPIRKSKG
jgi:hypothetical protein